MVKVPTLVAKNATRMGHPRKHKVPPLRFAPVGMTDLLREGIAQADREEFIEEEAEKSRPTWAAFSLIAHGSACHFVTRKTTLLLSTFFGVVTSTVPVVAPAGTVVVIAVPELLTANVG